MPNRADPEALTEPQRKALAWHWKGGRRWHGELAGDPAMSSLMALVRRGLSRKWGSAGWPIEFELTEAGRDRLQEAKNAAARRDGGRDDA